MESVQLTKIEYKAMWQKQNKEKMAQYARNYYHKRCNEDPSYKLMLCNKVKAKYIPKKKTFLNDIGNDGMMHIVDVMEEPFIFPDPTGLDLNMQ